MGGRITLGLYNSYDPNHFHEAMRRAIARAAPLCAAFDYNLALFGFPFRAFKTSSGETPRWKTPQELAGLVADSTTIGEGGGYLTQLAADGRFQSFPYPDRGFPPQLGLPVLATRAPEEGKRIELSTLARMARDGQGLVILVGLGPRGVAARIRELAPHHLEVTGKGLSLETATALGVLAGRLASAVTQAYAGAGPRLSVDILVERDGEVLLVRRAHDPFRGSWTLPGGFVDAGETLEQAALRELAEETGMRGARPTFVGLYDDPARDPRGHTVTAVYRVEATGTPRGGDDAAEARFHPWASLPTLGFDHSRILADQRARPPPRPTG